MEKFQSNILKCLYQNGTSGSALLNEIAIRAKIKNIFTKHLSPNHWTEIWIFNGKITHKSFYKKLLIQFDSSGQNWRPEL